MAKRLDDLLSLDPHLAHEFSGTEIAANLYETLVGIDPGSPGRFVPSLARLRTRVDGVRWVFSLDPTRRFASGRPVTAEDVVFSLRRAIAADRPPHLYRPAVPTLRALGLRVEVDSGDVVIEVGRAYAPGLVLAALASSVGAVLEKRLVLDKRTDWLATRSAGSGRFAIPDPLPKDPEPMLRDRQVILRANTGHPMPPGPGTFTILHVPDPAQQCRLLLQGKVGIARDLLPDALDQASCEPGIRVVRKPTSILVYLAMNVSRDPFGDRAVREAVRSGIDYERLADSRRFGRLQVHQAFLPEGISGASGEMPYRFDPARARSLLATQLSPPHSIPLLIDHAGGGLRSSVAVALADGLEKSGFRVTLRSQSARELVTRMRERDFQAALAEWGSDTMDPHSNAQNFCWNGDNSEASDARTSAWMCHWQDKEMNAAVEDAALAQDASDRGTKYGALQRRLANEGPFAFMLQEYSVAAFWAPGVLDLGFLSSQTRYAQSGSTASAACNRQPRGRT